QQHEPSPVLTALLARVGEPAGERGADQRQRGQNDGGEPLQERHSLRITRRPKTGAISLPAAAWKRTVTFCLSRTSSAATGYSTSKKRATLDCGSVCSPTRRPSTWISKARARRWSLWYVTT